MYKAQPYTVPDVAGRSRLSRSWAKGVDGRARSSHRLLGNRHDSHRENPSPSRDASEALVLGRERSIHKLPHFENRRRTWSRLDRTESFDQEHRSAAFRTSPGVVRRALPAHRQWHREPGSKLRKHEEAVIRLAATPGLGVDSAQQIIAEVGVEASAFPSESQFASWPGTIPGSEQSAESNRSSPLRRATAFHGGS